MERAREGNNTYRENYMNNGYVIMNHTGNSTMELHLSSAESKTYYQHRILYSGELFFKNEAEATMRYHTHLRMAAIQNKIANTKCW